MLLDHTDHRMGDGMTEEITGEIADPKALMHLRAWSLTGRGSVSAIRCALRRAAASCCTALTPASDNNRQGTLSSTVLSSSPKPRACA